MLFLSLFSISSQDGYLQPFNDDTGGLPVSVDYTEILQENHYYPFGMTMDGPWQEMVSDPENVYLYNGKELNEDFDLNWYSYGFREYDPAIGRFTTVDPLAETFSFQTPYAYAANNPISNIDVLGLAAASTQELIDKVWAQGEGTYDNNGDRIEDSGSEASEQQEEECCGGMKATANSLFDYGLASLGVFNPELWSGGKKVIPRFEPDEDELVAYYGALLLIAILEPSPTGELNGIKIVIEGGKVTKILKGVNSNLVHAIDQGVERGIFANRDKAGEILKELTKKVGKNDLPKGTIIDPSYTDRILVPVGNNGMAAYQIGSNGTAKLKTVLNAK